MRASPINCAVSACREGPPALTPSQTDGFGLLALRAGGRPLPSPLLGSSPRGQLRDAVPAASHPCGAGPSGRREGWPGHAARLRAPEPVAFPPEPPLPVGGTGLSAARSSRRRQGWRSLVHSLVLSHIQRLGGSLALEAPPGRPCTRAPGRSAHRQDPQRSGLGAWCLQTWSGSRLHADELCDLTRVICRLQVSAPQPWDGAGTSGRRKSPDKEQALGSAHGTGDRRRFVTVRTRRWGFPEPRRELENVNVRRVDAWAQGLPPGEGGGHIHI